MIKVICKLIGKTLFKYFGWSTLGFWGWVCIIAVILFVLVIILY